ncbi:MAG TPA: ABC transporter ATP-binding protein [Phycisphaerales bacterium]|nr:ABC transporter ATP-binding protein [Phycisphaerales bacterium]
MSTIIELENVTKAYDEGAASRVVLRGVSMRIEGAETVALLGASGSGKSTLLNIVSGLTVADSGTVRVAGSELTRMTAAERTLFRGRQVGFVFQFYLIPTLTVEENLRLPLQLNDSDDPQGRARVNDLLARVGLIDRKNTFPDRLSGGEQQRVAVCRALVHQPPVILADEPTGNLDGETAQEVLQLVLELGRESGAALLIVTHSEEVAAQCGRTLRIVEGQFADHEVRI